MRSIILLVLVVLCNDALGDCRSSKIGNYQVYQQNGGKPIFISSSSNNDDTEIEGDITDSDDTAIEDPQTVDESSDISGDFSNDQADKEDCNCKKQKPKITYGPEQIVKGKPETYIHHQPKIIVRQPPTHVRIEHPPTVIHPSTIVFRRHGKTIRRPVIYQHLPRDVRVRPVYVKVVRPIEKKVLVESKKAPCPKLAEQYKDENYNGAEEVEIGGESYSESFHSKESLSGHLNIKETSLYSK
jgi:hypothetical protein